MEGKMTVGKVAQGIITKLEGQSDSSYGRAMLAALRHTIGKDFSEATAVWPLIFENVPEGFLSVNGKETYEEKAILTALQIYAVQKQGRRKAEDAAEDRTEPLNIGGTLRMIRTSETQDALDRRFSILLAAEDFEETMHHLRQLLNIVKAKKNADIDFSRLSEDLFRMLNGHSRRVKLSWAQAYYSYQEKAENEKNSENEDSENEKV